jgi:hypothetical protein
MIKHLACSPHQCVYGLLLNYPRFMHIRVQCAQVNKAIYQFILIHFVQNKNIQKRVKKKMHFLDQKYRLFHRKIQNNTAAYYLTDAAFLFILRST